MKKILRNSFILSLLIIFVFIFLNQQMWLVRFEEIFLKVVHPFQKTIYSLSLSVGGRLRFFNNKIELIRENERLRADNAGLLAETVRLKETEKENELLRQQMGLPLPEESRLILAEVVGQNNSGLEQSFFIDKGKNDGVVVGAAVLSAGNFLTGQVVEIFDNFAKIRSIGDPQSRVNVRIQDRSVTGLARGELKPTLLFDLIEPGQEFWEGEAVITSGLAGVFPGGLLVGRIKKVLASDVKAVQQATISPAAELNNLTQVFVLSLSVGPISQN